MKNTLFSILFLASGICSTSAQTISAADQKGIEDVFIMLASAFEKNDASVLGNLLAENVEQIIPTGEIIRGRANVVASLTGYMEFLKSQPKADRIESKKMNQQYRYLFSDLVLTTYTDVNTSYFGDTAKVEKTTTSVILRKVGGKWLTELVSLTLAIGN